MQSNKIGGEKIMRTSEFIKQLDELYDAMDILDEKLKLRENGEAISQCAHHILGHKVKELINEYLTL